MIETAYFGPESSPDQNTIVGDFISRIVWGRPGSIDRYCTMAVMENGELIAGTAYHNWHPESGVIELTSGALSKRWLTRPVIRAMFHFPFDMLKCQLVALRVSEKNTQMVRISRSFGFAEVLIPRLRGKDEGEYVFTFTDDQWRASPYRGKL